MGRTGLHPAAAARTTPAARRGRAIAERLAMRAPALPRRVAAWVLRAPQSRLRRALIAYGYRRTYAAYNRGDWELNTMMTLDHPLADIHAFRGGTAIRQTMFWDRSAGLRAAGVGAAPRR